MSIKRGKEMTFNITIPIEFLGFLGACGIFLTGFIMGLLFVADTNGRSKK